MNKADMDLILSDIFASYRLQELPFTSNSTDFRALDYNFRGGLYSNYDYQDFFNQMIKNVNQNTIVDYQDEFNLHYVIYINKVDPNEVIHYNIVGPITYDNYLDSDFDKIIIRCHIPPSYSTDLKEYMYRVPMVPDIFMWRSLLLRMFKHRNDELVNIEYDSSPLLTQTNQKELAKMTIPNSTAAFLALEARYEIEAKLLEAVQHGNIEEALHYENIFMGFKLENNYEESLRHSKNMVIALNTLLRKAVQLAYVHPLYIDDLNGKMGVEIENVTSQGQLNNLCNIMIRKYCLLVKSHSRDQLSSTIREILTYIDFHYQEKLNLSDFADKYNITKNHLSTLFHKEVKMTMTDYINSTRLDRAILLLNTTDVSMQDIADQCGFSDANYFTRTFKKYKGMSPLQYRKSLQG